MTRINEKAREIDATDGSGALGCASVELTFRQGGGGGGGGGVDTTSLRPDSLNATEAADNKSGAQLPVPESEAATMRKDIARHVCASLSILPERVRVTVLQSDVVVNSWGTTPVTKATVEITAATPGQTHSNSSNALTCALALASQACDTSSPLCKRLPALLSGQLVNRTRPSPTPMCDTMSPRTLPSTRPSQYPQLVAQDFPSAEPALVQLTMTLGMSFHETGEEGSSKREAFKRDVANDLAKASGFPAENFKITKLSAGSVIVEIDILPDSLSIAPAPSAVARDLEQQAADPNSPLRSGKLTSQTQGIQVKVRSLQPPPAAPASLKPTPMGLVGGETLVPTLDVPSERVASGGGGWAGVKLQGQQQICKGPPHVARQFPRGYACACMPGSSLFLFKSLNLSLSPPPLTQAFARLVSSPHLIPGPPRAQTLIRILSLLGLLDGARSPLCSSLARLLTGIDGAHMNARAVLGSGRRML